VGIDVSKAKVDVALRYAEQPQVVRCYDNNDKGVSKLLHTLSQAQGEYKIVMESTGRYHWLVALRLSAAGYDVRMINPLRAKPYSAARIRKVKSDLMQWFWQRWPGVSQRCPKDLLPISLVWRFA
jgi:transposase